MHEPRDFTGKDPDTDLRSPHREYLVSLASTGHGEEQSFVNLLNAYVLNQRLESELSTMTALESIGVVQVICSPRLAEQIRGMKNVAAVEGALDIQLPPPSSPIQ